MAYAKKQKIITIETHKQTLIRFLGKSFVAWCDGCGVETSMLTPEQAAHIYNTTQRNIFRRIENGELHFIETTKGKLFICGKSLENKTMSIQEEAANGIH